MLPALWALVALSLVNGIAILISYITSNSFPQPLTEEEEAKYLKKFFAGDESARQVLIERNLRLVAHIIKKFDRTGEEFDDLVSIGTIGLIKALNTYNPNKTTRLATYASRCIKNEILMHLRVRRKIRAEISLYDPLGTDKEGNEVCFIDILGTDPEMIANAVADNINLDHLRQRLKKLPAQERKVIILRFGLINGIRYTQREVAKNLGISRSYVSRIEKRALNKLINE